jgi:hypothetical protein
MNFKNASVAEGIVLIERTRLDLVSKQIYEFIHCSVT